MSSRPIGSARAFGYPSGASANAQPAIVAGRVFVGSDNGYFYSLDAKTGCVYWSFENGSIVRNAPTVAPISSQDVPPAGRGPQLTGRGSQAPAPPPQRYAVFFGDGHANVYALDAQTGKLLARGGAIASSGAVVVDGMVFVGSGYAITDGAPAGNVLLAFGID